MRPVPFLIIALVICGPLLLIFQNISYYQWQTNLALIRPPFNYLLGWAVGVFANLPTWAAATAFIVTFIRGLGFAGLMLNLLNKRFGIPNLLVKVHRSTPLSRN